MKNLNYISVISKYSRYPQNTFHSYIAILRPSTIQLSSYQTGGDHSWISQPKEKYMYNARFKKKKKHNLLLVVGYCCCQQFIAIFFIYIVLCFAEIYALLFLIFLLPYSSSIGSTIIYYSICKDRTSFTPDRTPVAKNE